MHCCLIGGIQLLHWQRNKVAVMVPSMTKCPLQDVALIDARRGANMFRKINVPLLGIVENMSHYECPACGHKEHIFGEEGALRTAEAMKMDVLGQVGRCSSMMERTRQCC